MVVLLNLGVLYAETDYTKDVSVIRPWKFLYDIIYNNGIQTQSHMSIVACMTYIAPEDCTVSQVMLSASSTVVFLIFIELYSLTMADIYRAAFQMVVVLLFACFCPM